MTLDSNEVRRSLARKGFTPRKGRNHTEFYEYTDASFGRAIGVPVGGGSTYREFNVGLVKALKRELHLDSLQQVERFVRCPLTREEYKQHLTDKFGPPRS